MRHDQRLLMVVAGEGTLLEKLLTRMQLAFSPSAKARYQEFAAIRTILATTLSDQDDRVTVNLKRPGGTKARGLALWALFAILMVILFFEWKNYTIPILVQWFKFVAHRCGVQ